MYDFILQTIVMLSLGTMVYVLSRAIPRIQESDLSAHRRDYFDKLVKKLPLEKADTFISSWLEKFLRKAKVVVLKLDNTLTKHLKNLKPDDDKASQKPNIFSPEDARRIEKKEDNGIK